MSDAQKLREAIQWARTHWAGQNGNLLADAAEKHLATLPQTKMVEVWHVEYAVRTGVSEAAIYSPQTSVYPTEDSARQALRYMINVVCGRVTGPHKHEVPA